MKMAVIPARGGSKRIPRKNIKPFLGKPMIAWSIEAAQRADCFDRIIVSTDDDEIADVARYYKVEVPYMRPASLADDYTSTTAVVAHAVDYLQCTKHTDLICCIYATAPFVSANNIQESLCVIEKSDADYCFTATSFPYPIQRAIRITKDHRCEMFEPKMFHRRSQDLEEAYHDAGQFYWGRGDAWLQQRPLFSPHSIPYLLPRFRVQDIDTLEDWERAELLIKSAM